LRYDYHAFLIFIPYRSDPPAIKKLETCLLCSAQSEMWWPRNSTSQDGKRGF